MFGRVVEQSEGTFEVFSPYESICKLDVLEPNWRWAAPLDFGGDYAFKASRQPLQSASIVSAEHSGGIEAIVRHDMPRISIVFVLAGEIDVQDQQTGETMRISTNDVAGISDRMGTRLEIKPRSSWLMFQIPEVALRRSFEEMTGAPYKQKLALPPVSFREGGALGLYQTLRRAEKDLMSARPATRDMLAKAYKELALARLLAKLPHNLSEEFGGGISPFLLS